MKNTKILHLIFWGLLVLQINNINALFKVQELNLWNLLDCREFCKLFDDTENQKMTGWDSQMASLFLEAHYQEPACKEGKTEIEYKILIVKAPILLGMYSNVCAALVLRHEKSFTDEGKEYAYVDVRILAVAKGYRRKGLASLLLQEAEKISKEKGVTCIRSKIFSYNEKAISCFIKHGYINSVEEEDKGLDVYTNTPYFVQYMYKNL